MLTFDDGLDQLKPLLLDHKLIGFGGAGISVDSGIVGWKTLVDRLIAFFERITTSIDSTVKTKYAGILTEARLQTSLANPNLPKIADVLIQTLIEIKSDYKLLSIQGQFNTFMLRNLSGKPNTNHELLVGTDFAHIITTNYDLLLTDAADKFNPSLCLRSYSLDDAASLAAQLYNKSPSIIYMHGRIDKISFGDFVFTSGDYVKIRHAYPGFTLALKSLFLTHSILFVGYGGNDPHLDDLLREMRHIFDDSSGTSRQPFRYYMLMRARDTNQLLERDLHSLRTEIIGVSDSGPYDFSEITRFLRQLYIFQPSPTNIAAIP